MRVGPQRRRFLLQASALSCALAACRTGFAQTSLALPSTTDLSAAQQQAAKAGHALVVMVSLEGCPFCKIVRENYLLPLIREQQLPVVQIDMRSNLAIKDFHGKATTHDQLIRQWGVRVAPTVLFFGKDGKELAERLRGSYISDFYGNYLDARITTARKALSQ